MRSTAYGLSARGRSWFGAMRIALACATTIAAVAASAGSVAAWPTTWNSIGSCAESEAAGDESRAATDLVGATGLPAAYLYIDSNYLYLRERVAADPSGSGGFAQYAWVVLL